MASQTVIHSVPPSSPVEKEGALTSATLSNCAIWQRLIEFSKKRDAPGLPSGHAPDHTTP
jgi:hypothetical protein